jgi:hypothetical protein
MMNIVSQPLYLLPHTHAARSTQTRNRIQLKRLKKKHTQRAEIQAAREIVAVEREEGLEDDRTQEKQAMSGFEKIDALVEQLAEAVILYGGDDVAQYAVCKFAQSVGMECQRESVPTRGQSCARCVLLARCGIVQGITGVGMGVYFVGKAVVGW